MERMVRSLEIDLLRAALKGAGLLEGALSGRTWAVFVETDVRSWAPTVRALVEETPAFHEQGVRLVALASSPTEPPEGCLVLPFPVGVVPGRVVEELAAGSRSGSVSLVVYPDLLGVRLLGAGPPAALVRRALDRVIAYRLEGYGRALAVRQPGVTWRVGLGPTVGLGSARRLDERHGLVLDSGDPELVQARTELMAEANRRLEAVGRPGLFPEILAVRTNEEPAWSLLKGIGPPMAAPLFAEEEISRSHGERLLRQAVESLTALHSATEEASEGDRWGPVRRLIQAAGGVPRGLLRIFGPEMDPSRLLAARVVLPDGSTCRSFREQVRWLQSGRLDVPPAHKAWLHGAPVLENVFAGPDGVVFLGPRLVRGRDGVLGPLRGDPAEDLAILFTSVDPGALVDRAIALDETDSLIAVEESEGVAGPEVRVIRSLPRLVGAGVSVVEQALRSMRAGAGGPGWKGRFHLAAAASLFRALHGPRSVRPRAAWLVMFVAALGQLERARTSMERPSRAALGGH